MIRALCLSSRLRISDAIGELDVMMRIGLGAKVLMDNEQTSYRTTPMASHIDAQGAAEIVRPSALSKVTDEAPTQSA